MIMMRRQMTETRERQHVGAGMSSKIFQSAQPPKIFHCLLDDKNICAALW